MNTIAFRLYPGQDLRLTLLKFCLDRQIDAACIVTCVGSVQEATLRFAGASGATRLSGPFEIVSLVGTLSRHGGHLHVSLADAAGELVGGHLQEGALVHTTAEVILGVVQGLVFKREHDSKTGYRELSIEPKH